MKKLAGRVHVVAFFYFPYAKCAISEIPSAAKPRPNGLTRGTQRSKSTAEFAKKSRIPGKNFEKFWGLIQKKFAFYARVYLYY